MTAGGVQSLQAVWFTTGQSIKPVGDLYVAVFGNPAAAIQSAGINSMAAGVDGQTAIRLQVSPNRVDLILSAQAPPEGQALSLLPHLDPAIAQIKAKFGDGSRAIGEVLRLALVVNLSYPVASSVSASALIMEKLGLSLPFSDGRDMVFQVNRRGALCSVPGCELNRLIKWTAETHQLITLNAGVPLTPTVISADVATLMVDVNTVPTGGRAFQTDQQIAIFEEMAAEVTRICAAGTPSLLV